MKKILAITFSFFVVTSVLADLQMKIGGKDGTSTFSSNGEMVVIEDMQKSAGKQTTGRILMDHVNGDFYMIDDERNEIMKTSIDQDGGTAGNTGVSVSLKDLGGGPKIANYATRKHELIADGESCGIIYTSSKLLRNNGVRAIIASMRSMQQFSRNMMKGMNNMMSVCDRAEMQLADIIESSGVPMRIIDENGKRVSEVLAVDTNKKFPGDHYKLPAGMEVVDMSQRMKQAEQQTQQMMGDMPDMDLDKLMKQIQQGGGQLDDESKKQLEGLKKIFE